MVQPISSVALTINTKTKCIGVCLDQETAKSIPPAIVWGQSKNSPSFYSDPKLFVLIALVDANPVDIHGLRKTGRIVRAPRRPAADSDVQQNEKLLVKFRELAG